jgi:hypothetical protein
VQAALSDHVEGWELLSAGMPTLPFTAVVDGVDEVGCIAALRCATHRDMCDI